MNDELPSHVYYNLTVKNYSESVDNKQQIRFSESRQSAIIKDCSQYDLSIVRFNLTTASLPVYIAEIKPGQSQTDPNEMLHSITMDIRRGNTGSTIYCTQPEHLEWIPQDLSTSKPSAPSSNPDRYYLQSVSDYYYAYNFEHLCKIINNTFASLTTSLSAFDAYFQDIPPPFIVFDHSNNKFCIIAKQNIFSTDRTFPSSIGDKEIYVNIYFNRSLYNLFSTFYFIKQDPLKIQPYLNESYNSLNMHYQLKLDSFNDTNVLQTSNIQPLNRYLQIYQMASTVGCINPVSSIIFTSDMIPIIPCNTNKPNLLYDNNVIYYNKSQQQDGNINIISDFSPSSDMIVRSDVSYLPSAEYRYISLVNNKQEIRSLDIQVFWCDSFGILHPVHLLSGGSCSLKILFKRKY